MSTTLARARPLLFALLLAIAVAWAHAPLARSGPVGRDLALARALARLEGGGAELADAERLGWNASPPLRPLATFSFATRARLAPAPDAWRPASARASNLAWLVLAAVAWASFVRRALAPWLGEASARAAGWAAAAFALLHPAAIAAVARPGAHGDLIALALVATASWAWARGRQERALGSLVLAGSATAAAAFASPLAWLAPCVFALVELGAVRRPRSLAQRAARASASFALAAACAAIEAFCARAFDAPGRASLASALPTSSPGGESSVVPLFEKLGVAFLPVPAASGALYVLAAAVPLLAFAPALRAARAAPRAWSWLGAAWIAALCIALAPRALERVAPGDATQLEIVLPAAFALAAGLGAAATSLSGARRFIVPVLAAGALAFLARATAEQWPLASRELAVLHDDLESAARASPPPARVLVADPPWRAHGLDLLDGDLAHLLDPALVRAGEPRLEAPVEIRAIALDALPALARTSRFDAWRASGVALVADARAVPGAPAFPARIVVRFKHGPPDAGVRVWRDDGRSPRLELDPLALAGVRASAMPGATTSEAPRMGWRTDRGSAAIEGVWIAGADGAEALFDPSRDLAWLLGGRVLNVWFESPLTKVAVAQIAEPAGFAREIAPPRIRGALWSFDAPAESVPRVLRGEVRFVLVVLDQATLAAREIPGRRAADGRVEFEGVATSVDALAWWFEARVLDACVARAAGQD